MFAQANLKHANVYPLLSMAMEHIQSSGVSAVLFLFDSHQYIRTICSRGLEFTENVTSLPDAEAFSHIPSLALSASSASASSHSQTSFVSCDKLPGKSKGRTFQKSWTTSFSWVEWDYSSDKVLEKFRLHEKTETHKECLMKLASSSKQSVAIQLNKTLNEDMKNARSALMAIYTTLRFLCRQGLSIRGHEDLLELRREDVPDLKEWMEHSSYKWLSYDIKNEFIDILGKSVLHSVICEIKKRQYFAIMDFVGLYETPNTEGKTLFGVMKDILAHLDPNIENFLNLAVQDCLRHLPCMRNIMNLFKDLIKTVRESPKTVQLYKYIREDEKIGLRPLCPTRWTMRASSTQQVLINYEKLSEFFQTYSKEYYSNAASKCAG
ncbi:hypothetical protein PR048_020042 [Dryococelus australis]|uniref:Exocyst subunit Exo70 family protein n=1 Tax=Dryococelus australis TaxID=614101 RepID=A0ABQ9H564_9NEOP|nr:hypothetical protein PR048_020042 [Dryococelus australis]